MAEMLAAYAQALAGRQRQPDSAQKKAAEKLDALVQALESQAGFAWLEHDRASSNRSSCSASLFRRAIPLRTASRFLDRALKRLRPHKVPRGLYLWGDVGRGKTMLMDLFFASVPLTRKRRVHFNRFMADVHVRIHAERQKAGTHDPIVPVARTLSKAARLLCFDEFQVTDVADAMILGRLFEALFAQGVTIVATSNTAPAHLYEGGLNRQLFEPFIQEIQQHLEVVELNGPADYRLHRLTGIRTWLCPLSPETEAAMNAAWARLTGKKTGRPAILTVLKRKVLVPRAANGVARFSFADLCEQPLGGADYLAVARDFHTVMLDHVPVMGEQMRDAARRFILLIDTLYDEGITLIASAEATPGALYPEAEEADPALHAAFRRTISRLAEMQSADYLKRGHGIIRKPSFPGESVAGEAAQGR
jgi:cell division protein ZapE